MMTQLWHQLRRLMLRVRQQSQLLLRGVNGYDRRENRNLIQRLATLRADYNQLNQEMKAFVHYADSEIQSLRTDNDHLNRELDQLQLRIWELEQQLEALLAHVETLESQRDCPSLPGLQAPRFDSDLDMDIGLDLETQLDLSNLQLALVGGHPATRRAAIAELTSQYGLQKWVELPPFCQASSGRGRIKAKIQSCDLIVLITGYMNHKLSDSIYALKAVGALSGDILHLDCRGKSGVVRQILSYVQHRKR